MNYQYEVPISEEAYQKWKDHFPLNPNGHKCYLCQKVLDSKTEAWAYNGLNREYYCRTCGLTLKTYGKHIQRK